MTMTTIAKKQNYLATFTLYEGEREHTEHALLKATSQEEADRLCQEQEHGMAFPEKDEDGNAILTWFDYGDGSTRSKFLNVKRITPAEAKTVQRLGLVYFL